MELLRALLRREKAVPTYLPTYLLASGNNTMNVIDIVDGPIFRYFFVLGMKEQVFLLISKSIFCE